MKKKYIAVIVSGILLLSFTVYHYKGSAVKINTSGSYGDAMAAGDDDDALARINYETDRLKDPATGKIPDHIREKELAFAATLPSDFISGSLKGNAFTPSWQSRGPWNVGGRTRALGIDVTNENNIIAGSCSGGMWRSIDGGVTWAPTFTPAQHQNTTCLAQDKRTGHTDVWYLGSGEGYGPSASAAGAFYLGNGAYKSIDNGVTWSSIASTVSGTPQSFDNIWDIIWDIKTYPADTVNDVVFAATYGSIFRSANGGTSWTKVLGTGTSTYSYFTDVEVTPSGVVYATLSDDGPSKGIWRSDDGINFTNITPPNWPTAYNRIVIGFAPSDENQVYFLGNTPGFGQPDTNFIGDVEWNSIWKYNYIAGNGSGAGGLWTDRSAYLPTTGGLFDKFQSQGSYDLLVKVKPNDTNTVFIGGTNLYRSTSAFADDAHTTFIGGYLEGATLPVVNLYPNHHPDQHSLAFFASNPDMMLSSNDGGIFKTTDNTAPVVNWNSLNNGYLTTMFYTVALDHATAGSNVVIGGAQDNGSWYTNSAVGTDPWVTPRGGDGSFCYIADNESAYYFSIQNGKIMKAKVDQNGVIDSFARIDPIGATGYQFINPYTVDPNTNNIMYLAAGTHLWRNSNLSGIPYAANWDSISTNWNVFTDTALTDITAVTVSKIPSNRVYYGTASQRIYRIDNANSGSPAPLDITSTTPGALFPAGNISCIAVDPNDADKIMVAFSNYNIYSIFYSGNGGTTWSKAGGNLEQTLAGSGNGPSVRWISIMPVSNGTVYLASTSTGLYATAVLNGTSTVWVQMGSNTIGSVVCDMTDFRQSDGQVVVATHAHGIYSAFITNTNDVLAINEPADDRQFSLINYPNPVKEKTVISFILEKPGIVTVSLCDEKGNNIKTLFNESLPTGKHEIPYDCTNLKPGIYYYTVVSGVQKKARSLVKL